MKKLLLILLLPLFVAAQSDKPDPIYYLPDCFPKPKGKVKSIIMIGKPLKKKVKQICELNLMKMTCELYNLDILTIINYNRNEDIDSFFMTENKLKKLYYKKFNYYDSAHNIIQNSCADINGNIYIYQTFKYDSLGRWIEQKQFDSLGKETLYNVRTFKGNFMTSSLYLKGVLSSNFEYLIEKDKITSFSYFPDKNANYSKTVETSKGETKYITYENFDHKTRKLESKRTTQSTARESKTTNTKFHESGDDIITNYKILRNELGDIIETSSECKDCNPAIDYCNKEYKLEYKYIYDSHGNYTQKTVYSNGVPIYETNCTIEYYN